MCWAFPGRIELFRSLPAVLRGDGWAGLTRLGGDSPSLVTFWVCVVATEGMLIAICVLATDSCTKRNRPRTSPSRICATLSRFLRDGGTPLHQSGHDAPRDSSRTGRADPPAQGQGCQRHRYLRSARRICGVVRNGGTSVHQPRHASPGRPSALHAYRIHLRDLQGLRERRRALSNRCHRRHRGTAGLPLLNGACSLRPARCVVGVPEVHQHHIGYVLVLWSTGLRRD